MSVLNLVLRCDHSLPHRGFSVSQDEGVKVVSLRPKEAMLGQEKEQAGGPGGLQVQCPRTSVHQPWSLLSSGFLFPNSSRLLGELPGSPFFDQSPTRT